MLDLKNLLTINYYNGTSFDFQDATVTLGNPLGNAFEVEALAANDFIYIGYAKPIKNVYLDLKVPNAVGGEFIFEVSTEIGWEEINVIDETNGLSQSGMIQWVELENPATIEVNDQSLHWLRISVVPAIDSYDVDILPNVEFKFIGCTLSTDNDLLIENPYILDPNLLMNQASHINFHIAARNEIVQTFRNKGDGFTMWDILDIQEFRQASLFLALSKIYQNLSDNTDDTWMQKSREYRKMYLDQVNLYWKTIDKNNNGKVDRGENAVSTTKTLFR